MGDELDVETKLTLNEKPARQALLAIANDFDALHAHAIKTGNAIRAAMAGMRPEAKAFATTIGIANTRMNSLAMNVGKVSVATKPLANGLERANNATARLATQGKRAGDALTGSFERAGRAGGGIGSVVRSALGFASAYVGVQALSGAFRGLVTQAYAFEVINQKNSISLSAILAANDRFKNIADPAERMAKAGAVGAAVFRQLQDAALESVATSQELATIYTGISGPLLGAGAGLSEVLQITKDTVSAASVLGVDFAQAARDIQLMSTGQAGMDTRLFNMLTSTKAITQSTEEWNKMLPAKRLQAIKKALESFGPAGKAFEHSLPGLTSSFVDYMQRFRAAFMSGPLEQLRAVLNNLVFEFTKNRTKLFALATTLGNAFGRLLTPAVDAISNAATYFIDNWESIAQRIESGWKRLQSLGGIVAHFAPAIGAGAKAAVGASLVGRLAPGAVGGGVAAVQAGLAGGPAAGAGTMATAIAEMTHLISVVVAMGGAFTIILPIASILVGLFAVLADNWTHLVPILAIIGTFVMTIFTGLWGLVVAVFNAIMPLLKIIGVVVGTVLALGAVIGFVFGRLALAVFGGIISVLTTIFDYIGKGFTWVYEHIVGIFTAILDFLGKAHSDLLPKSSSGPGFMTDLRMQFDRAMASFSAQEKADATALNGAEKGAPSSRKTTVNDFRGSKIEVKQDFRQANPDNIWLQMLDGLQGAADQRLSSALVPDFTR